MELEDIIGRIVSLLTNKGIYNDTVVIFMSDNGAISQHDAVNVITEEIVENIS